MSDLTDRLTEVDTIDDQFFQAFQERLLEAGRAGDVEGLLALVAEDAVKTAPYPPGSWRGKDAIRGEVEAVLGPEGAFSEIEVQPVAVYLSLDRRSGGGHYQWRVRMTGPLDPPGFAPTGGIVTFQSAEFWQFRDGLVVRWNVISNLLAVARQIGAVPEPGSFPDRMGLVMQRRAARKMRRRADS